MKKLIYAVAFTLVLTSSLPTAWAKNPNDANISHLGNSAAVPNDAGNLNATHKFDVHVQGKALSELAIDLPERISIDQGIEVQNKLGQKIPTMVSMNNRKATIAFSEPVAPGTTISIRMKGVNTPMYSEIWQYQVYAKKVGFTEAIPLGLAQIQTYP
ncbi:DUF2808 domain-containing protein [Anabaena cylindrica FACHB-243]|uniref:DUF2808 domain-containing protein n=1 Tax=Anabaena cylindrica (strain ATCC 27899 / PCC 7122) TaxID=272123 RepID=K9ZPG7_ANACC|nr:MULTISPECIES: DUF2808 domain-containing protein [Anabaena]AFZ61096.1 hypothetical protein Anacy_5798 [Anabaena cylindrica PCC 7122]MBD2421569.1 DUF2808 domain-containing protein [Anabaena cylindrica FACHB-243]MBY5280532.1 DUF2808 domain-containing protein [Anabaena sp. CCAP 1446/1C]MBY5308121.1 DUF2808 domain-containing protein [Anabaena sp. CCAP 1446/1C]MCM2405532.1 DUF2808 domain-containing protein [Anabaena sp. CCAP 1446/1C]